MAIAGPADAVNMGWVSKIFGSVLRRWSRKSELSADRAGILACRRPQAMIQVLAKLAVGKTLYEKMNLDAFFQQKRDIDADSLSRLSETFETHPHLVNRIHEVLRFAESDIYRSLSSESPH
jgi:Zn-dependent protease with chaperone function